MEATQRLRALRWTVPAVGVLVLAWAWPAEAGRRRADVTLPLGCDFYVNETVDLANQIEDVVFGSPCPQTRDFTVVSDAVLDSAGRLVLDADGDPVAAFDYYAYSRLTPSGSGALALHTHEGILPRDPPSVEIVHQTFGQHVFQVPGPPGQGTATVSVLILDWVSDPSTATGLFLASQIEIVRIDGPGGGGDCEAVCRIENQSGRFEFALEPGASYWLTSAVTSQYLDLGPPDPATGQEPAFRRETAVRVSLPKGS